MRFPLRQGSGLNHWPFIAVALLLVVLILVTPSLTGQTPTSSLSTRPELIVDQPANSTDLYVRGIGSVRYASVSVGLDVNAPWPPPAVATNLTFSNWTDRNNTLEVQAVVVATTFAVNVSVLYVAPDGSSAMFAGVFVIHFAQGFLYVAALMPGFGTISPTPVTELPLSLLLPVAPAAR